MDHRPVSRPVAGASTAIVFVHGICGTPGQFDFLLPLVPQDWTLYNILLDGHGKEPADFARTSMEKWQAQMDALVDQLSGTHARVLLVGQSMGTLLSLQQALKKPDQVTGLFLMAVPMLCRVKPAVVAMCLRAFVGRPRPGSKTAAFLQYSSIDTRPWEPSYFGWLPRFFELLAFGKEIKGRLLQVQVPCRCYQSGKDEVVSPKNVKLLQAHPDFAVYELPDSHHFTYSPMDEAFLKAQFRDFIADNQ